MQERYEITCPAGTIHTLADVTAALETAATGHSVDLHIDYARMLADFNCLWMIVRTRLKMQRLPLGELRVETFLRKPNAAVSVRDFTLFDANGEIGTAEESWVLVDADARTLVPIKQIDAVFSLPTVTPERKGRLRAIPMPEDFSEAAHWTVDAAEIDRNGHLNNVKYIRHAEALFPENCTALEVIYDRECFAGETIVLQTARDGDYFHVRGLKADGSECFRLRTWRET